MTALAESGIRHGNENRKSREIFLWGGKIDNVFFENYDDGSVNAN